MLYPIFVCLRQWELSGKIYLFILENTNCTNNTNPCGVLSLLIAYELHEYHPDGKIRGIRLWLRNIHPAWFREIREIRVLLNIEILYSFGWISIRACMSATIYQTKRYLYLSDSNDFFWTTNGHEFSRKCPAGNPLTCTDARLAAS